MPSGYQGTPTLCFSCGNAVPNPKEDRGCNWSINLQPVEGWVAVPTRKCEYSSFCVLKCPEYIPDEEREDTFLSDVKKHRIEKMLQELHPFKKVEKKNTFQYRVPNGV